MRQDRLLDLSDIASGQWGLFTSAQATAVGVGVQRLARLARSEVIERLRHGVYRIGGVPDDPRTPLRAAWLALAPSRIADERYNDLEPGVVSHRSAAWAHGLGDLEADELEFSVPTRRQSRRRDTRFHVREVDPEDWQLVDGLPVTSVIATVRDLARAGIDGGHLAGVVRDALVDAHADMPAVAGALRPYAHRYGSRLGDGEAFVEELLAQAGVPTSTLDTAAAVTSRQVRETNELLASRAVVESLRYLQSPALQRSLAQLNGLTEQNAATAIMKEVRQLLAVQLRQATPSDLLADAVRQLSIAAGPETVTEAMRAMNTSAAEAARRAISAPLDEAVARFAEHSSATSVASTASVAKALNQALTAPTAEAAARLAKLSSAPSRAAHPRQDSSGADAPSTPDDETTGC